MKRKKSFLGYKGYSAVDAEDGSTVVVSVAQANESEINKLEVAVDQITGVRGQSRAVQISWHRGLHSIQGQSQHAATDLAQALQRAGGFGECPLLSGPKGQRRL